MHRVMETLFGVSDFPSLMFVVGFICGCSGRGSLADVLRWRHEGGSRRTPTDSAYRTSGPDQDSDDAPPNRPVDHAGG